MLLERIESGQINSNTSSKKKLRVLKPHGIYSLRSGKASSNVVVPATASATRNCTLLPIYFVKCAWDIIDVCGLNS